MVSIPRFFVLHGLHHTYYLYQTTHLWMDTNSLIILKNLPEHTLQNAAVFIVLHIHIRIQT